MKLEMRDIETRVLDDFPKQEFKHEYVLLDTLGNASKTWQAGDLFDWHKEVRGEKSSAAWRDFRNEVEGMIYEIIHMRANEIPRLMERAQEIEKQMEDIGVRAKAWKVELAKKLEKNHKNPSAYSYLRAHESRYTALESRRKILDAQATMLDVLAMCVVRLIQSELGHLLPLKMIVKEYTGPVEDPALGDYIGGLHRGTGAQAGMYVWHPPQDQKGNLMPHMLEHDVMRDYPLVLKQIITPKRYEHVAREYAKAAQEQAVKKEKLSIVMPTAGETEKFGNGQT